MSDARYRGQSIRPRHQNRTTSPSAASHSLVGLMRRPEPIWRGCRPGCRESSTVAWLEMSPTRSPSSRISNGRPCCMTPPHFLVRLNVAGTVGPLSPTACLGDPPAFTRAAGWLRRPVTRRSRSNRSDTARHPSASRTRRAAPRPRASPRVGAITFKDMRAARASGGRLAKVDSCWATRTSLERADMAMPTQIDQPASREVNSSWTRRCEESKITEVTTGWAKAAASTRKTPNTAYAIPSAPVRGLHGERPGRGPRWARPRRRLGGRRAAPAPRRRAGAGPWKANHTCPMPGPTCSQLRAPSGCAGAPRAGWRRPEPAPGWRGNG